MSLFCKKVDLPGSGLLKGATDNHSHLLYGVDDGSRSLEETLSILGFLAEQGVEELWMTPHIMEDVPNRTADLKARFERFRTQVYQGPIRLHLAAEYMLDNLYEERLATDDLLYHGEGHVLVETSTVAPPLDLWGTLERTLSKGIRPILAHPERYHYMPVQDYARLHKMGVLLQLNLPSILGFYGPFAQMRASYLLDKGWYSMVGSDCHRFSAIRRQSEAKVLKKKTLEALRPLMPIGGARHPLAAV